MMTIKEIYIDLGKLYPRSGLKREWVVFMYRRGKGSNFFTYIDDHYYSDYVKDEDIIRERNCDPSGRKIRAMLFRELQKRWTAGIISLKPDTRIEYKCLRAFKDKLLEEVYETKS